METARATGSGVWGRTWRVTGMNVTTEGMLKSVVPTLGQWPPGPARIRKRSHCFLKPNVSGLEVALTPSPPSPRVHQPSSVLVCHSLDRSPERVAAASSGHRFPARPGLWFCVRAR